MHIQANTWDELKEAVREHRASDWQWDEHGRHGDGTWYAILSRRYVSGGDHPAISAAAVELRKMGVSYATAKPILRRVFNAGKGAGA